MLIFIKEIEVVHIYGSHHASFWRKSIVALIAKFFFQKRVVYHIHSGPHYDNYIDDLCSKVGWYVNLFFKNIDCLILLSENWRSYLPNVAFIVDKYNIKVRYINNFVDSDLVVESRLVEEKNIRFLFLGKLYQAKGIYDLLNAFQKLKNIGFSNFTLTLGGDGLLNIKEEIRNRNLESVVVTLGWIDKDEKAKVLKCSDILILPSHSEGMPMVILEAMNAGLGIIASDVGGISSLVDHGKNGLLFKAQDEDDLFLRLSHVLEQPHIINDWMENSLIKSKGYNVNEYFSHFVKITNELLVNR